MTTPTGEVAKVRHPGAGKRKMRPTAKGRQPDPAALREIAELLGDRPRRRDLLIEHLHLIQDRYHHISARHLQALAEMMRIPMAEAFEVATFYHHFDVVKEGEAPPAPITVRVCESLSCEMAGVEALIEALDGKLGPDVRVVRAPCMGRCECAPVVKAGLNDINNATFENVSGAIEAGEIETQVPDYQDFDAYKADGGYALLADVLAGKHEREALIETMESSNLRGLGGAGFPAGRKWKFVRMETQPRVMAVNGDEGEVGTFKDRFYLERKPHQFIEGMLIAAWVVEATDVYIYLRDEYPGVRHALETELQKVRDAGFDSTTTIHLRRGAGAYICGEESAMIESIEGKRGLPRHRPPFVAKVGIFGQPTLVHNIETLYWVPEILTKGADWFTSHGRNGRTGLRSFSVSGRVKEPGVKLAPAGITINELIEEFCGGMADGHSFKGYLPGGSSGGILPASLGDVPMDFDTLQPHGAFIGSAAVVVLSDKDSMKDAAVNLLKFFEDESCGQCTPCRVGCEKAVKLMSGGAWDGGILNELSQTMIDASICGLGQAAPNPILTVLKYFPEDVS
ncbi:MAG: NAD(P)H-dependent oxidoreductase subunit E [Alphaproteobacteria bacterium]|jgi:formate dehydrogenase beta subunit|nr:NADH-quinone oxidoreductase subunit F [Rhodospirillaceae bacterium]MBT6511042.1 NADH-quinone oxidoreductase subunit F [Rhodospirillaceae bacterium]MDG2481441.1 NAD(P)H-dependent oxidoreductase subunit E [Alphaproteobacteria bacterium]